MKGVATQDSIHDLNSLENSKLEREPKIRGRNFTDEKISLQGKVISSRLIWLVDVPDSMLNLKNEK